MPQFWRKAAELIAESDVVNIHLPQFDAGILAWLARRKKVFSVLTYHCDLMMPPGLVNQISNKMVLWMNELAGKFCDVIVAYTEDYAKHSVFLPKFMPKVRIIQPPVELPEVSAAEVTVFKQNWNAEERFPVVGMACRLAADKGAEILLGALPRVLEAHPNACVFFAGPYDNVLGERAYYERLKPLLEPYIARGQWKFLGSLPPVEMSKFYRTIDLLTMPSLNRTDAFGLVQIEAMMNGRPVVASNLPGIRVPVQRHEMGAIATIGDSADLAEKLIQVIGDLHPGENGAKTSEIKAFYEPEKIAAAYEALFEEYDVKGTH